METDRIWQEIDRGRAAAAELLEGLDDAQWQTASLCDGWTVRDVAAHLTQAHVRIGEVWWPLVRSGFSVTRMTRDLATSSPLSRTEIVAALRGMVGSRRTAIGVTPVEPLLDILVHTQDIARPLGIEIAMPPEAAALAAERTFAYKGPMRLAPKVEELTFVATDVDWRHGTSPDEVRGPISELLMALAGRSDPRLAGSDRP